MSNIFSKDEMEAIVKRIEETYNVSGKQVKLTIEIIDDNDSNKVETHDAREKEVIKVTEELFDKMQDLDIDSESFITDMSIQSLVEVKYHLSSVRQDLQFHTRPILLSIDVEKCSYYDYKVTVNYRFNKCDFSSTSYRDYKFYMIIGRDDKISKISEKEF